MSPADETPLWLLLSVQAPPPGEEILLLDALRRLGAHAVEREGARYVALLPPPHRLEPLLREAAVAIRASTSLRDPWIAWEWRSRDAWAAEWSRALEPRRVGERMVVAPRDVDPPLRPGDLPIRLVPGPGFGTAEHPTTRGCLRLLERMLAPGDRVADVGAGSGILAIAAALLGAGQVLALEMDPHACAAAHANVAENGVADRVRVRTTEVRPHTLRDEAPFRGITANLQAEILLPLLPGLARALAPGGWLIVSGLLQAERRAVLDAAGAAALEPVVEEVEAGWWTAGFRR